MAGALTGQERRRRLLTAESAPAIPDPDLLQEFGICARDATDGVRDTAMLSDQLLRRLISRRFWKLATLTVGLCVLATAVTCNVLKPELSGGIQATYQTVSGLAALQCFLAGQLCMLIGWIRACSEIDYRGGYRGWTWLAISLVVTAVLAASGTAAVFTTLIAGALEPLVGRLTTARPALVMVPVLTWGGLLAARTLPDMGRCRPNQGLLALGFACGFLGVAFQIPAVAVLAPPETPRILLLWGSTLMLSATMLHARYVIYISHDPPVSRSVIATTLRTHMQDVTTGAGRAPEATAVSHQASPASAGSGHPAHAGERETTEAGAPQSVTETADAATSPASTSTEKTANAGTRKKKSGTRRAA